MAITRKTLGSLLAVISLLNPLFVENSPESRSLNKTSYSCCACACQANSCICGTKHNKQRNKPKRTLSRKHDLYAKRRRRKNRKKLELDNLN